jgi:hypothetical protein
VSDVDDRSRATRSRDAGPGLRDPRLLPPLLLVALAIELLVFRVTVPALAPPVERAPSAWHTALSYLGLFAYYFATALALLLVATRASALARDPTRGRRAARWAVALGAAIVVGLAGLALVRPPDEGLSFALELGFAATALVLLATQVRRGGDLGARLGLALFAAPLIVHAWTAIAVHLLDGDEARWNGVPDRVLAVGLKLLVIAAVASPYCLSPRPFFAAASRLAPLAAGAFVGVIGATLLRHSHDIGLELALRGFGIDLGVGAPPTELALYLLALSAATWTIVACLGAASRARRRIGVGVGLIVLAGYGFAWPLQYLAGLAGLLVIADAARVVRDEERVADRGASLRFALPPIDDEVWQRWVAALAARLAPHGARAVTTRGEGDAIRTHVVASPHGRPLRLTIERQAGVVVGLDVLVGLEPGDAAPAWTLVARTERDAAAHAPPPAGGPERATGDAAFDGRFRWCAGAADVAPPDEALRARAIVELDGWLAAWPGRALRHRLHPGRGAPLGRPIPIDRLAFAGAGAADAASTAAMASLLELLAALAAEVEVPGVAPAEEA